EAGAFRAQARALDLALRGPRPDPGLAGITARLSRAPEREENPQQQAARAALLRWWQGLDALFAPLESLFATAEVTLTSLIAAHAAAAQALACDEQEKCLLWAGADGETAFAFLAQWQEAAAALPAIAP